MGIALETRGLCKYFDGLKAVDDVSIAIEEGSIFGLIGPNGAGKTTLQNAIAGTFPPTRGQVFLGGKDVTGKKANVCCHYGLARTYQIVRFFPQMTAYENVLVGAVFGSGKKETASREKIQKLLDFVEFPLDPQTLACNLNTIQLKRLELARALATDCRVLFLDEVAAGLTPQELNDITDLIKKIRDNNTTILIVEHLMKLIMNVCDHIAVINFGQKIADASPEEVFNDPVVKKAYLGAECKAPGQVELKQ